jgi:hypothetical protein
MATTASLVVAGAVDGGVAVEARIGGVAFSGSGVSPGIHWLIVVNYTTNG